MRKKNKILIERLRTRIYCEIHENVLSQKERKVMTNEKKWKNLLK